MKQSQDNADAAFAALNALLDELPEFRATLATEADVRLKVVDTMLTEVLGWSKADCALEEPAGKGFLDYKLSINGVSRVVLEAKKVDLTFDLSSRECGYAYKLDGPVLQNRHLQEGIRQTIEYSAYKNTELACVTNGLEWVIFRSNRLGDGIDTLKGKAFVFGSLECIRDYFNIFYDLLSKQHVAVLTFRGSFQEAEGRVIRHSNFERALRPVNSAVFLPQADVVPELDRLMASFFKRLSNDHDKEMIDFCFVETKESKDAERRILRISEDLIGHIRELDTGSGNQLSDIIERVRETSFNQFVLIVGTKGAGKSTFIHRFFESKLPENLQQFCVPIFVNLADSSGDEKTIVDWAQKNLLESAEAALGESVPTWDELIGHMFFSEYQRWTKGTMSHLYKSNKEEFKLQFGKHIESIRKEQPIEYLLGILKNFVKGRKKIPCLIFDNADHFSISFQEKVFQFARSLFEQALCIVIMPITDKTSALTQTDGSQGPRNMRFCGDGTDHLYPSWSRRPRTIVRRHRRSQLSAEARPAGQHCPSVGAEAVRPGGGPTNRCQPSGGLALAATVCRGRG